MLRRTFRSLKIAAILAIIGAVVVAAFSSFSSWRFLASYFTADLNVDSKIIRSESQNNHYNRLPVARRLLCKRIWPDGDQTDDRIFSQVNYLHEFAKNRSFPSVKIVLRVGHFNFNHLLWKDGRQHLVDDECPITSCWFTSDVSHFPTADAVVISEFGWKDVGRFAPKPIHQVWVALYLEPPHLRRLNSRALGGLVNWTASYQPDSTIVIPYGKWSPVSSISDREVCSELFHPKDNDSNCVPLHNTEKPVVNYAEGRSKLIAMFVSSCEDTNGRRRYAWELSKYVPVDVYGDCGGFLSCPKSKKRSCFEMLRKNYKFYLSFENSNCFGYITEKLHVNALLNDVVPVVMGARPEDYASSVPPGSYIHVDDFKDPQHLADYLKILDSNDTLYNEYFDYKPRYRYTDLRDTRYWCRLCGLLHLRDHVTYVHWYEDFDRWTRATCSMRNDGSSQWKTWKREGGGADMSRTEELERLLQSLMK